MTAPAQALIRLSQETTPMCAACGRHPVARQGQLCNVDDKENLWGCAEKAAYFAARWRGIVWSQA